MRRRHKMGRKHSRKHFTHHAGHVHVKNLIRVPMRGGIRL